MRDGARRLLTTLALLAMAGCYAGEGSGRLALQDYPARDFQAVALSGAGTVTITAGDFAVSASAEDNVLPTLRVERHGETLMLGREVDMIDGIRPTVPIEFRIAMPTLDRVAVSGSGTVAVRSLASETALRLEIVGAGVIDMADVAAPSLTIDIAGAGSVKAVDVRAQTLHCAISGSGRMTLAGSADSLTAALSGASLLRASQLRASRVDVNVNGAGQAGVWATDSLNARIDGSGRVLYRGQPTIQHTVQRDGELVALDNDGGS